MNNVHTIDGIVYKFRPYADWKDYYHRTKDFSKGPLGDLECQSEYMIIFAKSHANNLEAINASSLILFEATATDLKKYLSYYEYIRDEPIDLVAGKKAIIDQKVSDLKNKLRSLC
jgi:hypothetical protein